MPNLPFSRLSCFPSQKQTSKFSVQVLPFWRCFVSWWLLLVILFLSQPAGYAETTGFSCILVSLIRRRLLQGFLMTTHACHIHTSDPLDAEALALNWALYYISTATTSDDAKEYVITQTEILSTAIQMNNVQDLPYWEAAQTVGQCATTFQQLKERMVIQHVGRETLKEPHMLANWARKTKGNFNGYRSARFREEVQL